MDPFDLLLQRLVSISEANIDPFKQSDLIEGWGWGWGWGAHFLMAQEPDV